ncbi:hypothetical protein PISMIDRAFT_682589, partial [Pisolithus microcarpus 441]
VEPAARRTSRYRHGLHGLVEPTRVSGARQENMRFLHGTWSLWGFRPITQGRMLQRVESGQGSHHCYNLRVPSHASFRHHAV